jgi:hypothetical protein
MANPITRLLARVDDELGITKVGLFEPPNLVNFFSADELNNAFDSIESLLAIVGLSAGTTTGSILRKLRSMSGPRETTCVVASEDFVEDVLGRYVDTVVAAGTVDTDHSGDTGTGSGLGHARLAFVNGVGSSAKRVHAADCLRGSHNPVFMARFRTPAVFADANLYIGLESNAGTSYARIACTASGVVRQQSASATGAGSDDTATAVTLTASTWYDVEIRITSAAVAYYIDGVLIGSHAVAVAIPSVVDDVLAPFMARIARVANGPQTLLVDWYETTATRL